MTDLWDEAIKAAARHMLARADREAGYSASHKAAGRDYKAREAAHLERCARQDAAAIRALPRPSEADRHAAIVAEALAWSRARAIWRATGRVVLYSFEDKLVAACEAELAALATKGNDA